MCYLNSLMCYLSSLMCYLSSLMWSNCDFLSVGLWLGPCLRYNIHKQAAIAEPENQYPAKKMLCMYLRACKRTFSMQAVPYQQSMSQSGDADLRQLFEGKVAEDAIVYPLLPEVERVGLCRALIHSNGQQPLEHTVRTDTDLRCIWWRGRGGGGGGEGGR